jgi:hypothetical protein
VKVLAYAERTADSFRGAVGDAPRARHVLTRSGHLALFALPNFFVHLTTAYDILRQLGVAVGKAEFLGDLSGFAG